MALAEQHSLYKVSYFHEMHRNSKGIIGLMKLNLDETTEKRCTMRYARYATLCTKHLENLGEEDLYFTQNTFKALSKAKENLLALNALYIDLDYYTKDLSQDYVLGKINLLIEDKEIPPPTFMVDSGRGLYLIWKIYAVPAHVLPLWKRLMENFYRKVKDLGADAKCLDPSRVLRVDGSINSKNKKVVHVIDYQNITYNINDLQQEYLNSVAAPSTIKSSPRSLKRTKKYTFAKNKNVLYLKEYNSLYHKRISDVHKLVKIRQGKMKDCREVACFLVRYWIYCATRDEQAALEAAKALNSGFITPLEENEIVQATQIPKRALELRAYRYGNKKIIEILKITEEEQEQLTTIFGQNEKNRRKNLADKAKRRNNNGLTNREQKKIEIKQKIYDYYKNGYKQKAIADMLGLSDRTIKRYYKEIKTEKNILLE